MYTCSFIVGDLIPKSVKCIHSATKMKRFEVHGLRVEDLGLFCEFSVRLSVSESVSMDFQPIGKCEVECEFECERKCEHDFPAQREV